MNKNCNQPTPADGTFTGACVCALPQTDWLYCGPVFNNCSHSVITPEQYHAKIEMMRRLAIKLNAAGIWPIYSTFNGFADTKYRDCPFPYDEYYAVSAHRSRPLESSRG